VKIDFKVLFSFLLFQHPTSFIQIQYQIWYPSQNHHSHERQRECIHTYIHTVHERFWHKLNNFSFCRIFEKIFITCAEVFIIIRKLRIYKFLIVCCWVWTLDLIVQELKTETPIKITKPSLLFFITIPFAKNLRI
jgi:hypothetical protein